MAGVRRVKLVWQGDTGQVYNLTLDASIHEVHTATSTVTDHPVETGSNISDHIRPDPDALTIEGHISNAPHFLPADHMGGVVQEDHQIKGAQITASAAVSAVPFGGGAVGLIAAGVPVPTGLLGQIGTGVYQTAIVAGFSAPFDRVNECYRELLRIRSAGQLVRILTTLRSYDNMAMTSLEVAREAVSGNALALSLAFKNVRFGSTKLEPVPKIPVAPAEKGTKTKAEQPEDPDGTSLLNIILNKGR